MNKLLIISDSEINLDFVDEKYDFINIRQDFDDDVLIHAYENDGLRTSNLRKQIEDLNPDRILIIGEMGEYIWLGTVITSLFGKFKAWLGQYDQDYAKTSLTIKNQEVPVLALKSVDDFEVYKEWGNE